MLQLRKAEDRGPTRLDWLDSRHTFSFGRYYEPRFTGFRDLLVINEDRLAPGAGFPLHDHQDMEIITYVIAGALEHRDSLGTGAIIRPGMVQRMSAGTGIRHSEYNASSQEPVHFLQIWISPEETGLAPSYEQRTLPANNGRSRLDRIGARDGGPATLTIHQDVVMYRAVVFPGDELSLPLDGGRAAWVQGIVGDALINGVAVGPGDGVALIDEVTMHAIGRGNGELLIFDLA